MTTKPTTRISIANDFGRFPAGRYKDDGQFSGETFREELLVPALKDDAFVEVDFDGTEGYGSSFLEEAFGGLIRHHPLSLADVERRLTFKSEEDPTVIDEVREYMTDAWVDKNEAA